MPTKISFKPKQVTKRILSPLHDRGRDVIICRIGLNDTAKRETLESIGDKYGITRERVRQIENAAIATIKKSDAYRGESAIFDELKSIIGEMGTVVPESELLNEIAKDKETQNHIALYLVLGDEFTRHKEDDNFTSRWVTDHGVSKEVHDALHTLYANLSDQDLLSENEIIARFMTELKTLGDRYKNEETIRRWLGLSKKIDKNPLGEWGKADSSNVKTRGVKDYAFLVMRKHGSPLHFREVAKAISDTFGRKTHIATCHNELIKDKRFVLVGRGIYALAEWGYEGGVVKDVIRKILKREGPLSKDDVVEKVLKERYLKRNTILVNLQNPKFFKKNKQGLYTIA